MAAIGWRGYIIRQDGYLLAVSRLPTADSQHPTSGYGLDF
jgi:hypothetical protein